MSIKRRTLKDKRLLFIEDIMAGTRDGELFILTKQRKKLLKDMIESMDSTSIDHSTLDQDSQCGELLIMFPTILDLEDMSKAEEDITIQEEDNKPSNSIRYLTLSSLCTPNPIHSISTATEVVHTSN
jgi:hypothetical protein